MLTKQFSDRAHPICKIVYQILLVPRIKIDRQGLSDRLAELLYECAGINRWDLQELDIKSKCIRMQLQCGPSKSVDDIVNIIKDGTSLILQEEIPDRLWLDLWHEEYLVTTDTILLQEDINKFLNNQL